MRCFDVTARRRRPRRLAASSRRLTPAPRPHPIRHQRLLTRWVSVSRTWRPRWSRRWVCWRRSRWLLVGTSGITRAVWCRLSPVATTTRAAVLSVLHSRQTHPVHRSRLNSFSLFALLRACFCAYMYIYSDVCTALVFRTLSVECVRQIMHVCLCIFCWISLIC